MHFILLAIGGVLFSATTQEAQRLDSLSVVQRVADAVCNKDIVLLGELPSHGEARGFQAKARIVERLVDRCGFDAVFIEAGVYDFLGFRDSVSAGRAQPAHLDDAIGRFWQNRELSDWRRWLFQRATSGRLVIAGLDDQLSVTSRYARAVLPNLVASASSSPTCADVVTRHVFWRYDANIPFDAAEQKRLDDCARQALDSSRTLSKAQQLMLQNFSSFVSRSISALGARERDEVMSRNMVAHLADLPKGAKVIIWTATVHAARIQGEMGRRPLGSFITEHWGDRMAAIGFTTWRGQSSMAGGAVKPIPEAPAGSLEALTTSAGSGWVFLDAAALRKSGNVPSRVLGRFLSADWSAYFDGVVVIRDEVAPTLLPPG